MRLSRFFSLLLLPALLLGAGCAKHDPAPAPPPTVPPVAAPVVSLEQALRADLNATVFLAALRKTALLPALSAPAAPLTVLAPTNAAFAELTGTPFTTAASIEALPDAGPDVAELRRLVQYHLLPVQALSAMPASPRMAAILAKQRSACASALSGMLPSGAMPSCPEQKTSRAA